MELYVYNLVQRIQTVVLWMSDVKDSHHDHKLRLWCHYPRAPRSCQLQVQNEMCMFNLESLETPGMVLRFAFINATSRSGKRRMETY